MLFENITEHGRYYLVHKKGDAEIIDSVTLGMIENNNISGVLPLLTSYKDADIEFRIDITECVELKRFFHGKVSRKKLLKLLTAIEAVSDACQKCMVDESQIILDPNYIYIKDKKLHCILLPLKSMTDNGHNRLNTFIMGLEFDRAEDCSYVAELNNYFLNNSSFDLGKFKNMVAIIERNGESHYKKQHSEVTLIDEDRVLEVKGSQTGARVTEKIIEDDSKDGGSDAGKGILSIFSKKSAKKKDKKEKHDTDKKVDLPWKILIPSQEDDSKENEDEGIASGVTIEKHQVPLDEYHVEDSDFGESISYYGSGEDEWGQEDKVTYYLRRMSTGVVYEIANPISKIGRKSSEVDICISGNTHVGKLHALIYIEESGLFILDNDSKNGTFINNSSERILEKTRLRSGDRILLGDEEFIVE